MREPHVLHAASISILSSYYISHTFTYANSICAVGTSTECTHPEPTSTEPVSPKHPLAESTDAEPISTCTATTCTTFIPTKPSSSCAYSSAPHIITFATYNARRSIFSNRRGSCSSRRATFNSRRRATCGTGSSAITCSTGRSAVTFFTSSNPTTLWLAYAT